MKAIVLLGGQGTRLRPLTYGSPKQMLPILGIPMLERVLGNLRKHGVTEAVLSLGYLPDQFISAYPDFVVAGVPVTYAVEPDPLDTAGGIRFAARHAGIDDTFIVVNGDVVTDLDVTRLIEFHRASGATATIALHTVDDPTRFGVVGTDRSGKVLAFVEKPTREEAPSHEINAGTYVMEPALLDLIEPDTRVNVEREIFPALVERGQLFALVDESYWLDTGTPEAYLRVHSDVLSDRRPITATPAPSNGSWVHSSAVVDPTATIKGATIDRGCRVGANAIVEDSVLLPDATVEEGAVVRGSIVGPGAIVGRGAHLGPTCVVGADEVVPENSHHEGDVRIGGPR